VALKNIFYLLLMMGMAAGAFILFGGIPVELPVDVFMSRGGEEHPSEELNAKAVDALDAGNNEQAVAILREAVLLEPENRVVMRNLSVALARVAWENLDDEEAALKLLGESETMWPVNPEALDGLSTLHYRAGRYEEALEYARKLKLRFPAREDLAKYVVHLEQRVASSEGMVTEEGDNFRLLYSGQRQLEYEGEILALLQDQMDSLTAALGIFPAEPVDVLILTGDLGARADPFDQALEGLYDGQIRLYVGDGIKDKERLTITVRHEMVHALLHGAAGVLPSWVQEGLAQKIGENPDDEHVNAVRAYMAQEISKGYVIDLAGLEGSFIAMDPERRTRSYAASLLLMEQLERSYGKNFIQLFVSELADGNDPLVALKSLTGGDLVMFQETLTRDLTR
jgi:tetratricopeptide (TPR) repeat protein